MRFRWMGVTLVLAAVAVLTVPGLLLGAGAETGNSGVGAAPIPSGTRMETLILDAGNNTSATLFGTTVSPRANLLPNEDDLVNATPDRTIVWPGAVAGDDYDPFNSSAIGFNHNGQVWSSTPTDVYQFAAWCREIRCTAIMQVPAEMDNSTFARDVVACAITPSTGTCYDPDTNTMIPGWGIMPAYWEIGNEPGLWTNWALPWKSWCKAGCSPHPGPWAYAAEVEQYIQNITPIDPNFQVIGLPGLGGSAAGNSGTWIAAVNQSVSANGSAAHVAGYAIHVYPGASASDQYDSTTQTWVPPSLSYFYDSLNQNNSNGAYQRAHEQLNGICAKRDGWHGCAVALYPLFITELGTSLSHKVLAPYSLGFPGALGEADEDIQMLEFPETDLANVDLFATVFDTNNSWFDLSGVARPTYVVASQVVSHLGPDAFPITTGDNRLEAIATIDRAHSDRHDFLVVNTNVNDTVRFNSSFLNLAYASSINPAALAAGFSPNSPVAEWTWVGVNSTLAVNNSSMIHAAIYSTSRASTPGPQFLGTTVGLPATISLPPQSLALFETYNAPAYPVNFSESGLNLSGTGPTPHWFVDLNGTHTASNQPTLTLLEPPGLYSAGGSAVLVPSPGSALAPVERLVPTLASPVVVGSVPVNVTFGFTTQWSVAVNWSSAQGTVTATDPTSGARIPVPNWWTNNAAFLLQVSPNAPYAFTGWFGRGAGRYGVHDANGSVSGYDLTLRVAPTGPIEEDAIFLPGQKVTFSEVGLPSGTPWSVSLRGLNNSSTSSEVGFYEVGNQTGQTWSYEISNVTVRNATTGNLTTYRFDRPTSNVVTVAEAPVTVPVNFSQLFDITFRETGLPSGTPWSLVVANGTSVEARGSSSTSAITVTEAAGDWGFRIANVSVPGTPGYRVVQVLWNGTLLPSPDGNVSVREATVVTIRFVELTPPAEHFLVTFTESTLPANATWSMTFFNQTLQPVFSNQSTRVYSVINGTWFYNVSRAYLPNGSGFRALNSAGLVSVSGLPVPITLVFVPLTPPAPHFSVTFSEADLPANATWSINRFINFTLQPVSRTQSSIVYSVINGTWFYNVSRAYLPNGSGYRPVNSPGNVTVNGANVSLTIVFTPLTPPAPHSLVTFTESGLPANAKWSVTFFNATTQPIEVTPTSLVFNVTVGTWWYNASRIPGPNGSGYRPLDSPHRVTVTGIPTTVVIQYVPLLPRYPVTFDVTGLPPGANYEVRLSNITQVASVAALGLTIPDGTWTFDVIAPAGYYSSPSHGSLTMNGRAMVVTIAFLPIGRGPNPPFLTLVLPAATTSVVLCASGLCMFSILGAFRRRRTGAPL
jgi:hypothetical protein